MSVVKGKGPIIDPGVCRCCGGLKKCRLLNVEYSWLGHKETYSEMFVDCFGLLLSHLDGEVSERLICATCVTRLRDASLFRQQVLKCEEKLLRSYIQLHEGDKNNEVKHKSHIKNEKDLCMNQLAGEDYDDTISHTEYSDIESTQIKLNCAKSELIKLDDTSLQYLNENSIDSITDKFNTNKVVCANRTDKQIEDHKKSRQIIHTGRVAKTKMRRKPQNQNKLKSKTEPPDKQRKTTRFKDRSFLNAITIVENSYVCPFNTFFNNYYCIYCRQKFIDPEKLRDHTLTHDPSTYKEAITNLFRHGSKKCQIDLQRIDCRLCNQRINDLDTFKIHINKVHGKKIYPTKPVEDIVILKFCLTNANPKCTECGRTFTNFHMLKIHMAEHFGTYVCDICGTTYFEERMLIQHLKSHKKSEETFPCTQCGKTFKCKYNLTIHTARLHTKEAVYLCSKCDDKFFSDTLRRRHMIQVHNEESRFKCKNCDKVYDNKRTLGDHNRRIHLKVMKHQCNICEKRFFVPCRLKEHMSCHTGERNYRCEHCGKSYPRLRALKVHVQSHSAEKKYKCALCNASYSQNVCLKNHIKRQHQSIEMDDSYQE